MKKYAFLVVAVFTICATLSCHHHDTDDHHLHDGEQMTAYTADYELFAEMPPLIVGEECTILAHLTRLSDFKPLDSVQVDLLLSVDGKKLTTTLNSPQTPGIYSFEIKPEHQGCGSLTFIIHSGDSIRHIEFPHLHIFASHEAYHNEDEDEHDHHHNHDHHASTPSNSVVFTKEQSWKTDFATEVLQPEPFGSIIRTSAQVLPSQGDERQIAAKTSGIVVFHNPNLIEGSQVSNGQQLFSIESNGMADNNMNVRYQEALSNYSTAKADYERKQQLAQDKIVSQADLQRTKAVYESAKVAYDNLKGNFSAKGAIVSAPMSGFIKQISVINGGYVEAGQPVVTISQNRDLFIRAEVQPRYYADLKNVTSASFSIPNTGRTYTLDELAGSLVNYGKATDIDCPLIPVTFRFRNTVDLVPGNFVTLYIRTSSDDKVLAIPNTGIVEEMGNSFVFVQVNPELFEKRLVSLGATDGFRTVILSGVRPGERVVTRGAIMVKLAQSAGALDPHAGHVHSH